MKKKIAIYVVIVAALTVILAFTINEKIIKNKDKDNVETSDIQKEPEHRISEGHAVGYYTLAELEKASPIIVKGTKINSEPSVLLRMSNGEVGGGYTISNFKIGEIIKNKSNQKLEINDIIPILENEFYDDINNIQCHVNGYLKMIDDKDYLLLLKYAEDNKWYVSKSATFGKVPLDNSEPLFYIENESKRSTEERIESKLLQEAREKYE